MISITKTLILNVGDNIKTSNSFDYALYPRFDRHDGDRRHYLVFSPLATGSPVTHHCRFSIKTEWITFDQYIQGQNKREEKEAD
ncbi:hypothetical protein NL54_00715 [Pantoea stewartii]|nr:hypothetical protein NL54_00715 [Pantoea stewartii]KHN62161.1 hypothetical protein OI73_15100 [Pantoea stewartii]